MIKYISHSCEHELMKIIFCLQTNGTDTMTKKSASLTGKEWFLPSRVHSQPFIRLFIEKETNRLRKLLSRTSMSACSILVSWALGLSTHQRIIYKHSLFLAEKGIKLVQEGQYAQAVSMFTEAIKCDPKDNRYIICDYEFITKGVIHFRHVKHILLHFLNYVL